MLFNSKLFGNYWRIGDRVPNLASFWELIFAEICSWVFRDLRRKNNGKGT